MSKVLITSDLHLGHSNILKFRDGFSSLEEHNETLFDNLATDLGKRDHLLLLGDIAFTPYWQERINSLVCGKKTLIMGNHDTDRQVPFQQLVDTYDNIHSLWSKKNCWFSHCPIHPQEFRSKQLNLHGHLHTDKVRKTSGTDGCSATQALDHRYINVCTDQTNFRPVDLQVVLSESLSRIRDSI